MNAYTRLRAWITRPTPGGPLADTVRAVSVSQEAERNARCRNCLVVHATEWCPLERAWNDTLRKVQRGER